MNIKFSRHAKRRLKLYKISEEVIVKILEKRKMEEGYYEIVEKVELFKYSLKIVVFVTNDLITVVTNYPLKKGRKNENSL